MHGLAAQLGAWEKFESEEAGVITYFHLAFYRLSLVPFSETYIYHFSLFVESGMKEDLIDLAAKYPTYRIWVCFILNPHVAYSFRQ